MKFLWNTWPWFTTNTKNGSRLILMRMSSSLTLLRTSRTIRQRFKRCWVFSRSSWKNDWFDDFDYGLDVQSFALAFFDGSLDRFGKVFNVLFVDASKTDSSWFQQVNVILIDHNFTGLFTETSVGEHSNLVSDMVPFTRGTNFLQSLS